ncbi:hypothetical protein HHK36_020993 [Tetracentron sinense]|uniref:Kinesin motor domain-containing protein n=1 Tax=Tetracentron sinense TaxID=13715 RepID=A0A834YYL7_TETSI|nr:hypothetical protein HHK36_020993 [Tetracentron sinense]
MQMQEQFEESEVTLEKKVNELEHIVTKMRKEKKEDEALELQCEKDEKCYRRLIDYELGALTIQKLKVKSQSIEIELVKIQKSYSEECNLLGAIFKQFAESYHMELRNNRRLFNELQDLKGGRAKTVMFVHVNPDVNSYSKTRNALKFAERVSGVELGAAVAEQCIFVSVDWHTLRVFTTFKPEKQVVPDASIHPVTSTADVIKLITIGLKNKTIGATDLNERRAIFEQFAESYRMELADNRRLYNELQDLKGVMLGGQAKTVMFVQVNPDVNSYLKTRNALKFAERVSGVELGAAVAEHVNEKEKGC